MKKQILLFLLFIVNACYGMKSSIEDDPKFVAMQSPFKRMVSILECANIKLKEDDFFYGNSFSFDIGSRFYVAVKNFALSQQIFGENLSKQYARKTISRNRIISEVEVPFDIALQYIEKKWGYLLKHTK